MLNTGQEIDDNSLVIRVAGGDVAAMEALYRRHAAVVQRFVHARVHDHFEVADIVHNAMLDVWRSADRFQGRSSVRSWILSIARNKTVDHIRKQGRVVVSEPDEMIPDDAPAPEDLLAAAQDAEKVRNCVSKLGAQQKSAVHLAFFEELTYGEIAEAEGVPEGTIKTRIYHAKKLLMRCLTR